MLLPRLFIMISMYLLQEVTAQIVVALNTTNIVISNSTALASDPFFHLTYPSDSLTFTAFTPTSIWTLSLNNTVQILDKANISLNLNSITQNSLDFRFQSTVPLSMIIFDENYDKAAITGFVDSCLVCYLYDYSNSFLPILTRTITVNSIDAAPATSFIADSILYSFFSNKNNNDTIFGVSLLNNSTVSFTLPTQSASLAISPNRKYALVWNQYTKVYIYSVPNFTLLYTYNDSIAPQKESTDTISFSTDGDLALIESDNHNPVVVLNLTNFSILERITIHGQITSVNFIDADNRYIMIVQNSKSYVYDLQLSLLSQFNATLPADSVIVDQNTSQMIVVLNSIRYVTNVEFSTGNSSAVLPEIFTNNTSNISNTSENTNSTVANQATHSMSYMLNLSQAQNQTFAGLQSASAVVLNVMTNFNLVIFSSPFTCFFLGFFNYFALNSLYVLLNIQLPDIIFKELSALYANANANLLTSFGISFSPASFTHELVDSPRGLHFGVSSDLLSSNYYPIGLVLLNSMIFQLILAIRTRLPKTHMAYSLLDFDRHQIYFGFAVYLMVGLILPSQFVITKKLANWPTVANSAVQCLLYVIVTQFLWSSLIEALRGKKAKRVKKENKKDKEDKKDKAAKRQQKSQIPEWMIAFQNLLYPLLVLLPSPSFFLVAVLISKISEIVVFSKHTDERGVLRSLQVGSFFCQVIYHCTFIVFYLTHNQEIIIYNSLFCLIFFYLGAVLNLVWTVLFFIKLIKKIVKAKKNNNQIADGPFLSSKLSFQRKKKTPPLTILLEKPIVAQKKQPVVVITASQPASKDPIKKTIRRVGFKRPQLFLHQTVDR